MGFTYIYFGRKHVSLLLCVNTCFLVQFKMSILMYPQYFVAVHCAWVIVKFPSDFLRKNFDFVDWSAVLHTVHNLGQ